MSDKAALKANIWKFYIGSIFGTFEISAAIFVLFLMSNDLSMTQIMLLQAYFTAIMFLLEVPSGAFADLIGRKTSIVIGKIGSIAAFVTYALSTNVWGFMLAETFFAIGWAMNSGADSALIYDTLKEIGEVKRFKKVMGNAYSLITLSLGFATLIGGFIVEYTGYRMLFIVSGVFFAIGTMFLLSMKEPKQHKKIADKNYFKHLKEGVKFTWTHKDVRKYMVYYSFFGIMGFIIYMFLQPYVKSAGYSDMIVAFCVSGFFFFNALGYKLTDKISRWIKNDDKILLTILGIGAVLLILMGMTPVWLGAILVLLALFFSAIKETVTEHAIHDHTDSSHRATVLSVKSMAANIVYTILAPIFGILADKYGPNTPFTIYGYGLLIFLVIMIIRFKNHKKN